jgi:hypothetical protein
MEQTASIPLIGRDLPGGDAHLTLREARARFFARMGIAPDGGYEDRWVKLKAGPIPFAIPNTKERRRSVRLHDLHHILAGYSTDWVGEGLISAFEIGGGCADHTAAWVLNLGGMLIGAALAPRDALRAFVRGRRTRNLYRTPFTDALLDEAVGDVRERLGLAHESEEPPELGDVLAFLGWVGLSCAVQLGPVCALAWWLL